MQVRCNQCMAIFNEDEIVISEDPLYMKDQEICPKCFKGGALMDISEEDIEAQELEAKAREEFEQLREDDPDFANQYGPKDFNEWSRDFNI